MGSIGELNNSTMLCAPLMADSLEQMISDMHRAKDEGADLVEVRLDCINNFQPHQDLKSILNNKPLPVIIVYRPKWEGGQFVGDEHVRLETLILAKELGADYVDIEFKAASALQEQKKIVYSNSPKIIVSYHLKGTTPSNEELINLAAEVEAMGADIVRVVAEVTDITELNRVFHLHSHCQVPVIACSIGERGLLSQLLSAKYGGFLAYGSIEGQSIPGVPTLDSLRQTYKLEHINSYTKVFGLVSKPVSHSKGPLLHNPTFRQASFNGVYVPMFVDDLKQFFSTYRSPDFAGYSVGFPYKEAVLEFCDEIHPIAQSIGAVNTIIRRPSDGKLIGYNTDCEAAITAIEDALEETRHKNKASFIKPLSGKLFVLVGAGGAGRALAFSAKTRGTRIIIFDIDFARAKSLAHDVSGEALPFEELPSFHPEKGAILANATPVGMQSNTERIPVSQASLEDYEVVFDAVYTPRKTKLLKDAEAAGAITVSGVEMFLRQAIGQFTLFTGREAPEAFMREIVLAKF